ncbi:MAG: hypothetical protein HQK66_00615 [Desulfamplus sp.]|nr:hypothetical protein [Desulfamplus sp.]
MILLKTRESWLSYEKKQSLDDLLAFTTQENIYSSIDTGVSVGKEEWQTINVHIAV